ncbi:protein of unknown function [Taphrina deformans PYCC 5710]|uniref:Reverse transcriptase n=1 Tax=Taphrina deformans (strain PYCC 5710 / ATCC 11124 / CBS 356.35 / IMI 108563 / JCM 9778 / NBRC 8474) TaxID=1097556 RepID=R4XFE9_TAPDE|nr:protein of unknown function [Taphrina deformans PYCC 5710]|eukprot:CCG84601.2 protein of unknown function [Taphrina deformans PYCC 5710]
MLDPPNTNIVAATQFLKDSENLEVVGIRLVPTGTHRLAATSDNNPLAGVPGPYHQFSDLFSKGKADVLPNHGKHDHTIPLEPGQGPPFGPLYGMTQQELGTLKEYIDDNLSKGFIRQSSSPAGAPVLFVKKKDGSLRLCVDYRGLNAITIKDRAPLPLIKETFDCIRGSTVFTCLDLRGAYNLLRVAAGEEWRSAFRTRYGLFEYCVMPFGLCNAPATFQTMINDVLRPFLDHFVVVYLDDICIYSKNQTDHVKHVTLVLETLEKHNLYVKAEKCIWHASQVPFLGFIISDKGIAMDPAKITSITAWPEPTDQHELQVFLGFANFYQNQIGYYSKGAKVLYSLLKKDKPWAWTLSESDAFRLLKQCFVEAPIRRHFDPDKPSYLETDASDGALGGILSQTGNDGLLHPCAYHSRTLQPAELNYEIHDKELLAIVDCFKEWRIYLQGAKHKTTVWTDHKNLVYFTTTKTLNQRQTRWSQTLSEYDFIITYRAGKANVKADALSRRSDLRPTGGDTTRTMTLLKPAQVNFNTPEPDSRPSEPLTAALAATTLTNPDLSFAIKEASESDPKYQRILIGIRRNPPDATLSAYSEAPDNHLLLFENCPYVPDDSDLFLQLLNRYHDHPTSGHQGIARTFDLLNRDFYWPGMRKFCIRYVSQCKECNRNKTSRHKPYGLLKPLPIPDTPWTSIAMDYIVKLPPSKGFDFILVVVCRLTKMAHFIPCREAMSTEEFAQLFVSHIFRLHSFPQDVVSDRGSHFRSAFWKQVLELCHIKGNLSTSFHPQTDGQTERTNQTLEQYLRLYCNYEQDDWARLLPMAEFACNNAENTSTQLSPFMANYGYHPRRDMQVLANPANAAGASLVERLATVQQFLQSELAYSQQAYSEHADEHRLVSPFKVGQEVWLNRRYIDTVRPSRKLDHSRLGPFKIIESVNDRAFKLDLPATMRIHNVFHPCLLDLCVPSDIPGRQKKPPPPVEVDNHVEYEVQDILRSRTRRNQVQYLVKWQGYNSDHNSWEPASTLEEDVPSLVQAFRIRCATRWTPTESGARNNTQ